MAKQAEQVAHSELVGGGETTKHFHARTGLGGNLIRNSPGQIVTDGVKPQWWDNVANATITDEDTAGEGIAAKHERCFKVVTTANDVYGYQAFTFADEGLLAAGQAVISLGCWVYCASSNKASIGIYGTNLGLQESAQHTGGGFWEWLKVDNKTLNGADTGIEVHLIVDTGTAFFAMPMLCVNGTALPWKPRACGYVPIPRVTVLNTTGTDVAWSDLGVTANTHNLATAVEMELLILEPNGAVSSYLYVAHHDDVVGGDFDIAAATVFVLHSSMWHRTTAGPIFMNDQQQFRYKISEADTDSDLACRINLSGYYRWD